MENNFSPMINNYFHYDSIIIYVCTHFKLFEIGENRFTANLLEVLQEVEGMGIIERMEG